MLRNKATPPVRRVRYTCIYLRAKHQIDHHPSTTIASNMRRPSPINLLSAILVCWLAHCNSALVVVSPTLSTVWPPRGSCSVLPRHQLFGSRVAGRQHGEQQPRSVVTFAKDIALRMLDTRTAIDCRQQPALLAASSSILGFWGHSGLALISIVLVKIVYALFFRRNDDDAPQQAGILNRCPWPFIFFHDIKQGFKDSPTWMVVTWVTLWRLTKIIRPSSVVL